MYVGLYNGIRSYEAENDYISHIHIFIQVRSITFRTKCDLKKGNDSLNLVCES